MSGLIPRKPRALGAWGLLLLVATVLGDPGRPSVQAKPINPKVHQEQFEKAREAAEVVASVRVLAAVCTKAREVDGHQKLTLQLCLQVKKVAKGPAKEGEVLVVIHRMSWSDNLQPTAIYLRQGELHSFPCVAGVNGEVALRWDPERRCYVSVAGWVRKLPEGKPPTEAGKVTVAPPPK